MIDEDIVYRLRKRAEIRRQIPNRKSVIEGKPDRISDLLEEAANEIEQLLNIRNVFGSALMEIGNYAHYHSAGPAIPDGLWHIRAIAYDALREVDFENI